MEEGGEGFHVGGEIYQNSVIVYHRWATLQLIYRLIDFDWCIPISAKRIGTAWTCVMRIEKSRHPMKGWNQPANPSRFIDIEPSTNAYPQPSARSLNIQRLRILAVFDVGLNKQFLMTARVAWLHSGSRLRGTCCSSVGRIRFLYKTDIEDSNTDKAQHVFSKILEGS